METTSGMDIFLALFRSHVGVLCGGVFKALLGTEGRPLTASGNATLFKTIEKTLLLTFSLCSAVKSCRFPFVHFYATTVYLGRDCDAAPEPRRFRIDGVEVGRFGPSKGSCQLSRPWMPGNISRKYDDDFVLNAEIKYSVISGAGLNAEPAS